jgi:hypothetical protein
MSVKKNFVPSELNSILVPSNASPPILQKELVKKVASEISKGVLNVYWITLLAEKPAMNILVPSGLKVIPEGEFWPLSLFFGTSISSTNDETAPKALKLVRKKINNKLVNFSNFTSYF